MAAPQKIIIDTDPRNLSAIRTDTGDDVSFIIDHAQSGLGTPMLVPGFQSIRWTYTGGILPEPDFNVIWNERYLSADDITSTTSCSVCGC